VIERWGDGFCVVLAWWGSRWRAVLVGVAVVSLAGFAAWAQSGPQSGVSCVPGQRVWVPDAGLRHGIESMLHLPEDEGDPWVPCETMLRLTRLWLPAPRYPVASLEGLQAARNLTWLQLDFMAVPSSQGVVFHTVSDLSPLAELPLRYLFLATTSRVEDLAPVGRMHALEEFFLGGGGQVTAPVDASFVDGLPLLRKFTTNDVRYRGLEPFTRLEGLESLALRFAGIRDVHALRWWIDPPKVLKLEGNGIADLSPLVENPAFGAGDEIDLQGNCIGTVPGVGWEAVSALRARGVRVVATPLRQAKADDPRCRPAP